MDCFVWVVCFGGCVVVLFRLWLDWWVLYWEFVFGCFWWMVGLFVSVFFVDVMYIDVITIVVVVCWLVWWCFCVWFDVCCFCGG